MRAPWKKIACFENQNSLGKLRQFNVMLFLQVLWVWLLKYSTGTGDCHLSDLVQKPCETKKHDSIHDQQGIKQFHSTFVLATLTKLKFHELNKLRFNWAGFTHETYEEMRQVRSFADAICGELKRPESKKAWFVSMETKTWICWNVCKDWTHWGAIQ